MWRVDHTWLPELNPVCALVFEHRQNGTRVARCTHCLEHMLIVCAAVHTWVATWFVVACKVVHQQKCAEASDHGMVQCVDMRTCASLNWMTCGNRNTHTKNLPFTKLTVDGRTCASKHTDASQANWCEKLFLQKSQLVLAYIHSCKHYDIWQQH